MALIILVHIYLAVFGIEIWISAYKTTLTSDCSIKVTQDISDCSIRITNSVALMKCILYGISIIDLSSVTKVLQHCSIDHD